MCHSAMHAKANICIKLYIECDITRDIECIYYIDVIISTPNTRSQKGNKARIGRREREAIEKTDKTDFLWPIGRFCGGRRNNLLNITIFQSGE